MLGTILLTVGLAIAVVIVGIFVLTATVGCLWGLVLRQFRGKNET